MPYEKRRPDWWVYDSTPDDTLNPADLDHFENTFESLDSRVQGIEDAGIGGGVRTGREEHIGTSITLTQDKNGVRLVATTQSILFDVPSPGVLGNGFECQIWNDSGGDGVTISGIGDQDVVLDDGDAYRLAEVNGKQFVWQISDAMTRIDDTAPETVWNPLMMGPNVRSWWDATRNVTSDPFSFAVSQWIDRAAGVPATMGTAERQPFFDGGEHLISFTANQGLSIPGYSRSFSEFHWFALTFRVDWTTVNIDNSIGGFVVFNGSANNSGQRQPLIGYRGNTESVAVQWRVGSSFNEITIPASGDDWHVMVGRRVPGGSYLSIDGGAETYLAGRSSINLPNLSSGTTAPGLIGDFNQTSTMEWDMSDVVIGQRFIEQDDLDRLAGWALWKVGAEDQLPVDHPYALAPPDPVTTAVEPPDGEDRDAYPDWTPDEFVLSETNRGTALDRTGFVNTLNEDFNWSDAIGNHITDGAVGLGPWYSPARSNTSSAHVRKPTDSVNPYIVADSVLTIEMTYNPTGGFWNTGMFQSVNTMGEGFKQKYGHFEARIKLPSGTPVSWPAFWLYSSDEEYVGDTQTRCEIDVIELYATDPAGHHCAVHRHPPARKQVGHLQANVYDSNITYMDSGGGEATWGHMDTFWDDEFHIYGVTISPDGIFFYFDEKEVARCALYPEADREMFVITALQMQDGFLVQAQSPARMHLDWIRVWQLP